MHPIIKKYKSTIFLLIFFIILPFVMFIHPLLLLGILGGITFILLSFKYTYFTFYLILFFLPFQFSITPNHYTPYIRLILPLFTLIYFSKKILKKQKIKIPITSTSLIYSALIIILGTSLLTTDWTEGIGKYLFVMTMFAFYFLCYDIFWQNKQNHLKKKRSDWREFVNPQIKFIKLDRIIKTILWSSTITYFLGLLQVFIQLLIPAKIAIDFIISRAGPLLWGNDLTETMISSNSWYVVFQNRVIMRAVSLFPSPHHYIFYIAVSLPIYISLLIYFFLNREKISKLLFLNVCLGIINLFLTFSRGGYLCFGISILFLAITSFTYIPKKFKLYLGTFIASILIVVFLFSPQSITNRVNNIFNLGEASNMDRVNILNESFQIFKKNWLFGAGYGQFDSITKFHGFDNNMKINAHNTYLELGVEIGIIGPILMLALLSLPIINTLLYIKRFKLNRRNKKLWLYLGIVSSLVWIACNAFFEMLLYSPVFIVMLCLWLAVLDSADLDID